MRGLPSYWTISKWSWYNTPSITWPPYTFILTRELSHFGYLLISGSSDPVSYNPQKFEYSKHSFPRYTVTLANGFRYFGVRTWEDFTVLTSGGLHGSSQEDLEFSSVHGF